MAQHIVSETSMRARMDFVRSETDNYVEMSIGDSAPRYRALFGEPPIFWLRDAAGKLCHRYAQAKWLSRINADDRWMGTERYILTDDELTGIHAKIDCRKIAAADHENR